MLMEYRQFAPNYNSGNNTEPAVDRTFFFIISHTLSNK